VTATVPPVDVRVRFVEAVDVEIVLAALPRTTLFAVTEANVGVAPV
jgi:hypothetical protein